MEPMKISAKNLGYTALEKFCPRCYWLKLKMAHKLPWQSFPGIFSSIDAYTKHCMHHIIDHPINSLGTSIIPEWMKQIGDIVGYEKVPHWSKSLYTDQKTNITLSGVPDDIWVKSDGSKVLPDYKTAKHTDAQDKLFPMYEIQGNVYSILLDKTADICLIYMEPETTKSDAELNIVDTGFKMGFNAIVVPIETDRSKVRAALTITREIFEMEKPPESAVGCKDCELLDNVMETLK
jgi:hypothetical protein